MERSRLRGAQIGARTGLSSSALSVALGHKAFCPAPEVKPEKVK